MATSKAQAQYLLGPALLAISVTQDCSVTQIRFSNSVNYCLESRYGKTNTPPKTKQILLGSQRWGQMEALQKRRRRSIVTARRGGEEAEAKNVAKPEQYSGSLEVCLSPEQQDDTGGSRKVERSLKLRLESPRETELVSRWLDYDTAVQRMDLERALEFLDTINRFESAAVTELSNSDIQLVEDSPESGADGFNSSVDMPLLNGAMPSRELKYTSVAANAREDSQGNIMSAEFAEGASGVLKSRKNSGLPLVEILSNEAELSIPFERQVQFLKVLNAGLVAEDMQLVSRAYNWLQTRGMLRTFGSLTPDETDVPRTVTPKALKELAGLEASKLSPKKWGSGNALAPLLVFAGISALVNNGVDIRPLLVAALSFTIVDAVALGGTGFGQILSQWKPYKQRIVVHEAGHVVAAYLLGCPVRGVVLDTFEALKVGIQGQAGTQFWDSALEAELRAGRLTGASIDRYCIVLFAGIAAEALVYGEAKGGESDENMFKAVLGQLQPAWSPAKISNQARWAVLQAYLLLRKNRKVLEAVVEALHRGAPMGELARVIEESAVTATP